MKNRILTHLPKSVGLSFLIIVFSLFSAPIAIAQNIAKQDTNVAKKINWNVNIGSSIMGSKNSGTFVNTFIAPNMNYDLGKKWSIGTGVIISNTTLNNYPLLSSEIKKTNLTQNFSQMTYYVNGSYQATDRLTINAMVYKSLDINKAPTSQLQNGAFDRNFKGIMMDVNYKVTEHTSINIGFNYSDGANNPFSTQFPTSGFGMNGMRNMHGW